MNKGTWKNYSYNVADYLAETVYDDYDKLIQLCDALSLANEYCYAEKKMVNSMIKFGFKDTTINNLHT